MNSSCGMENVTTTVNLTDSRCFVEDPGRTRPFLVFYLAVIVIAIPSNAFSLYVSWQHIRHGNELGVFLFNLALSDLTNAVGLALWVDFLWRGAWLHGGYVCLLSVNLLFTNFYTSDAFLCCIALNRYLAVVHPLRYRALRRLDTATGVSGAIWALVICFNATTISWEDSFSEDEEEEGGREGEAAVGGVCFDVLPVSDRLARVNVARFVLGFALPAVLVAFCCHGIRRAVRSNLATERRERRRVSQLLAAVLLSLALCFGPVHVMMLLRGLLPRDCATSARLLYPYRVTIAVSALNCLADPLLYCLITRTGQARMAQALIYLQARRPAHLQEAV